MFGMDLPANVLANAAPGCQEFQEVPFPKRLLNVNHAWSAAPALASMSCEVSGVRGALLLLFFSFSFCFE